jgi:hypothetical protein
VLTGPVLVEKVLTDWLEARKAQLAPSTADRYRVAMKLIPDSFRGMPVAKLRAHHIEDLYAELVAAGQCGWNHRPLHSGLDHLPPAEFEALHRINPDASDGETTVNVA